MAKPSCPSGFCLRPKHPEGGITTSEVSTAGTVAARGLACGMPLENGQSGANEGTGRGHWREGKATPQILKAPLPRSRRPRRFRRHHHHPLTADLGAARGRMLGARDGKEQKGGGAEPRDRGAEPRDRVQSASMQRTHVRVWTAQAGSRYARGAKGPEGAATGNDWGLGTGERAEQQRR